MAEYAVEVDKAQQMGEAAAVFEKADKAVAVYRILVKIGIDFLSCPPPCTQRLRCQAADVVVLLNDVHGLENMSGLACKQGFVFHRQQVAHLIIIGINLHHHPRQARIHPPAQHGLQNAAELFYGFGGAVKRAH